MKSLFADKLCNNWTFVDECAFIAFVGSDCRKLMRSFTMLELFAIFLVDLTSFVVQLRHLMACKVVVTAASYVYAWKHNQMNWSNCQAMNNELNLDIHSLKYSGRCGVYLSFEHWMTAIEINFIKSERREMREYWFVPCQKSFVMSSEADFLDPALELLRIIISHLSIMQITSTDPKWCHFIIPFFIFAFLSENLGKIFFWYKSNAMTSWCRMMLSVFGWVFEWFG